MEHQTPTTANRVTAAALGGALTILLVWLLEMLLELKPDEQVPAQVVVAMTTVTTFFVSLIYSRYPGLFKQPPSQQGFVHPLALALMAVVAMGIVIGCQSQGHRAPETMYERLLIANSYGEYATRTVNDLRRGQVISSGQHQRALNSLQDALDASRTGRVAYQAANLESAQDNLVLAEAAMTVVATLLAPHLPDTPENQAFITRYGGSQ